MISVNQVTVSFGGFQLFKDINFLITPRDRIGLVGKNGAGKSTLLKMIVGEMKPTSGSLSIPNDIRIGYLPQQMVIVDGRSVMAETLLAFNETIDLKKEIDKLGREIAERTDYESDSYTKLINLLADKTDHYNILGGGNIEAQVEQTLTGLGFKRTDFDRPTSEFSGGWRMRIELAKLLLRKPAVLLLDEPTNHLDIESIQWLEEYLSTFPGALLLISHDKAFLDNVTQRTIELSLGVAYDYKVSYSKYVELHRERREQQMSAYRNQQKMIEDTQDFIERFRYKATKAVQVQSRIKQLDKLEIIEVDDEDLTALNIKFPPAPRSGDTVVEAKEVSKNFGNHLIFSGANFSVQRGEKVAFVGRNGEGKTTMSRIIIGELNYTGNTKIGHNVSIGYFAQNQDELLNNSLTVLETIDHVAVGDVRTKMRDILGAFLFRGDDVDKKVGVLSGGERNRLAMAKLMLQPYNLLILDEPTNHLDMRSKDILKEALLKFDGTLIIVSHDREFLNGLVEKVYEFSDGIVKEHLGGIYDFLRRRKLDNLKELERKREEERESEPKSDSDQKQAWLERKEMDKQIRKVVSQLEDVEGSIEKIEAEIAGLDAKFANPDPNDSDTSHYEFFSHYQDLKKELNDNMNRWEELSLEVEGLKVKRNQ
ncbi:MAG: ABC-F family ATP-binding cassette domain-containing protein [Bacteroidales bacterium]|nr:ABC-F family ATP-binding cassette domain-containing protein [Bacteroidales bacterium]